jgi:mRNA interferase HicA
LIFAQKCATNEVVKAGEFKRKVLKLARSRNLFFAWDTAHGKGSHGTITLGGGSTTLKDLKKEIGPGLLKSMCIDLGIMPKDLNDV